jgi:hypothetical protein
MRSEGRPLPEWLLAVLAACGLLASARHRPFDETASHPPPHADRKLQCLWDGGIALGSAERLRRGPVEPIRVHVPQRIDDRSPHRFDRAGPPLILRNVVLTAADEELEVETP